MPACEFEWTVLGAWSEGARSGQVRVSPLSSRVSFSSLVLERAASLGATFFVDLEITAANI